MCYFINLKIRLNTGIFNNILVCKEQINVEINKERIFVRLRYCFVPVCTSFK